jgi:hypothetical protein
MASHVHDVLAVLSVEQRPGVFRVLQGSFSGSGAEAVVSLRLDTGTS